MKFLADENVPLEAVNTLSAQGLDITSVATSGRGLSDLEALRVANASDRVVITFDMDFGELIFRRGLRAPGLMLLRFTPNSPSEVAEKILDVVSRNLPIVGHLVVIERDLVRTIKIPAKQ